MGRPVLRNSIVGSHGLVGALFRALSTEPVAFCGAAIICDGYMHLGERQSLRAELANVLIIPHLHDPRSDGDIGVFGSSVRMACIDRRQWLRTVDAETLYCAREYVTWGVRLFWQRPGGKRHSIDLVIDEGDDGLAHIADVVVPHTQAEDAIEANLRLKIANMRSREIVAVA